MNFSVLKTRWISVILALVFALSLPGAGGAVAAEGLVVPPPGFDPLNQSPVPIPPNIYQYVTNKTAAVQLGKAFYWDMQTGSDGATACATCHFAAGADNRKRNTLNPGTRAGDTVFGNVSPELANAPNFAQIQGFPQFKPNYEIQPAADFPLYNRAAPEDSPFSAVTRDTNDVVGSQGIHKADFVEIVVNGYGDVEEITTPVFDPIYNLNPAAHDAALNLRQVTARNTPTVINAVFNFNQFWDGRASFVFNGENPFGTADQNAGVWFNKPTGLVKEPVRLIFGSLASQATGPPLDSVEMSAAGRIFPDIGRKLLNSVPLGKQIVSHDDSVLGGLSNSRRQTDGSVIYAPGLHDSYAELIRAAFHDDLWNSAQLVNITRPSTGQVEQFSQMEANFAFFWGVSLMLYEGTLVSDQTPFDHWLGGDNTALTNQQKDGFALFNGIGNCSVCHGGIEMTSASVAASGYVTDEMHVLLEIMFVADGGQVIYDNGFNNTAVTPTSQDIGRGGDTPFSFTHPTTGAPVAIPLSFSELAELYDQGLLPYSTPILLPGQPNNIRLNTNGAFKVPGLRNVELTTPYFHNGSKNDLESMIDFYVRGGNFGSQNIHDLDPAVGAGIPFMQGREDLHLAMAAFLKSLTDPRVVSEAAPFDHPELFVPNGYDETLGKEIIFRVPAKDFSGTAVSALGVTLNPVTTPTITSAQTISGTVTAGLTPVITVNTIAIVGAVNISGTNWNAEITGLAEGANVITVKVTDQNNIQTTVGATIIVDTVAPAVTLAPITPPVLLPAHLLTGTAEIGVTVKVAVNGGLPASAARTGAAWSYNAPLVLGNNTITVTAIDSAGNQTALNPVTISAAAPVTPSSFSVNLAAGWGLLSTPVKLDAAKQTLSQIFGPVSSGNVEVAYGWNGTQWVPVTGTKVLLPLEAIYVKVAAGATVTATLVPSTALGSPVTRDLTPGLNLIGIAPAFAGNTFPAQNPDQALVSIVQAEGGNSGYTMLISPGHNQTAWTAAPGEVTPELLPFKGYWVIMDNPDILYGFCTTPLSLY